jgi:hypothetical protein
LSGWIESESLRFYAKNRNSRDRSRLFVLILDFFQPRRTERFYALAVAKAFSRALRRLL